MFTNIWNAWPAALFFIMYIQQGAQQEFSCIYNMTHSIKVINRTADVSLRESQTQRELKCRVEDNYVGLDVFPCTDDFSEAIKQECLLCGKSLMPGSEVKTLCSNGKDDPDRYLTCEDCQKQPNSCLNNGTGECTAAKSYGKDFKCNCPKGFNGTWCENKIEEIKVTDTFVCNCSSDIQPTSPFCNQSRSDLCYTNARNTGCLCKKQTNIKQIDQMVCSEITDDLDDLEIVGNTNEIEGSTPNCSSNLEYWKGIVITWIFLLLWYVQGIS